MINELKPAKFNTFFACLGIFFFNRVLGQTKANALPIQIENKRVSVP